MTGATLARLAAAVLSTEKGRKTVGWVIAAILSPLILLAAFLCSFGTAAVEHNNFAVSASFYGPAFTDKIPTEYKDHICCPLTTEREIWLRPLWNHQIRQRLPPCPQRWRR